MAPIARPKLSGESLTARHWRLIRQIASVSRKTTRPQGFRIYCDAAASRSRRRDWRGPTEMLRRKYLRRKAAAVGRARRSRR